jgi:hypothetical protein
MKYSSKLPNPPLLHPPPLKDIIMSTSSGNSNATRTAAIREEEDKKWLKLRTWREEIHAPWKNQKRTLIAPNLTKVTKITK